MTKTNLVRGNAELKTKRIKNRKRGIEGNVAQFFLVFFLLVILFLALLPVLVTIIMSFKAQQDITAYPIWTLPQSGWMFSNYSEAFVPLSLPMLNTVVIDLISSVIVLLMSCYVAFLFEWQRFGGRKVLFYLMIAPMLVPSTILLSPTYVVAQALNITESWLGLILPYIAGNQISTVFMLKTFMGQQPDSLYEAAQLDGANKFHLFCYVCLPLTFPIMMVQGIGIFAAMYNDYLWPQLIFLKDLSKGVLMPYLKSIVLGYPQGVQYAMYLVAGIPLIITTIISIKFFINGDFASGMKL